MKMINDEQKNYLDAYIFNLMQTNNYRRFIDKALNYADIICMTYNKNDSDFKKSSWSFLKNSVIRYEMTKQTAVTKGLRVCLIYLKKDKITTKWLKEKNHIYDFICSGDEWLDDLCLIKNDEIVFCSCTHEEFCYMSHDLAELIK